MSKLSDAIGSRVKSIRETKGWKQRNLAAQADLPEKTISRIERGFASSNVKTLYKVCKAFRITLSDLFRGID